MFLYVIHIFTANILINDMEINMYLTIFKNNINYIYNYLHFNQTIFSILLSDTVTNYQLI